nr:UDP-xylose transporter 3 [Ipomoea batatas]
MSEGQRFQLGTIGALSLSVVSSVSIVILQQGPYQHPCFTFATTLTSWHLLVTFCSLHVALWMKLFEHKPFDPRAVMGFGILNGTSIGLLNLSLGFNSVGFYQKLEVEPFILNVLLFPASYLGILTHLAQMTNTHPEEVQGIHCSIMLNISFCELQYFSCNWQDISCHLPSLRTSENLPCFSLWIYVLLRDPFSWRNILGIFIAVVGMILYSYYCTIENQQKSSEASVQVSQCKTDCDNHVQLKAKESESDPLISAEKGGGHLVESGIAKSSPGWNSNKDLQA